MAAVDGSGHLFIADTGNGRVREVDLSSGIITTVAGDGGTNPYLDGGGAATATEIGPESIAVDALGHLFVGDYANVFEVDLSTGAIATVAGAPYPQWPTSSDGGNADFAGPATGVFLEGIEGISLDANGDLFICSSSASSDVGPINSGSNVVMGNNGGFSVQVYHLVLPALFGMPEGLLSVSGTVNVVREVDLSTGQISTVVGNGDGALGFSGDGGPAIAAALNDPMGLAVDANGDLFIADSENYRVREVAAIAPPAILTGQSSPSAPGLSNPTSSASSPRGENTAGLPDSSLANGPPGSGSTPIVATGGWGLVNEPGSANAPVSLPSGMDPVPLSASSPSAVQTSLSPVASSAAIAASGSIVGSLGSMTPPASPAVGLATATAAPTSALNPQAVDAIDLSSLATNQSPAPITGLDDLSTGIGAAVY